MILLMIRIYQTGGKAVEGEDTEGPGGQASKAKKEGGSQEPRR